MPEGPFVTKFIGAIIVVFVIFVIARPGSLGLWTIALLALVMFFFMGFHDPTSDYPENKYKNVK